HAGSEIVALDLKSGDVVWRQPGGRVIDAVTGVHNGVPSLWYAVSGSDNPVSVTLYRVDVATGERKQITAWTRPAEVTALHVALAGNRIVVASISQNASAAQVQVGVDAMDASSGVRLWQKQHEQTVNVFEARYPAALFLAQRETLVYSVVHDIF